MLTKRHPCSTAPNLSPLKEFNDHPAPYYHVVPPCVRRAYLCGADHAMSLGQQWVAHRIHTPTQSERRATLDTHYCLLRRPI